MSHFKLYVIGPDIDAQLAPFQENNMDDCPEQYLVFNDLSEDYAKEDYETKKEYPTLDKYAREYCGFDKIDKKTGKYGRWENPNKKWDWYQIGGRYQKSLISKKGRLCNQLYKRDLDRDALARDADTKAKSCYAKAHENHSDAASRSMLYGIEPGISLEDYIAHSRSICGAPFAWLHKGKWYECGKMGWFGLVTDEEDELEWARNWWAFFDSLPDDALITIVDCHI